MGGGCNKIVAEAFYPCMIHANGDLSPLQVDLQSKPAYARKDRLALQF